MDKDYLFNLVQTAVEKLYIHNTDLFASQKHNENTLCSKLANYIEKTNNDFSIDYDHNWRSGINGVAEPKLLSNVREGKNGFKPDIIMHHRGNDNENLIAIEVKGFWNQHKKDWKTDGDKLIGFTSLINGEYRPFHYELGIFIALAPTIDGVEYALYSDGKQISNKKPEQICDDFKKYRKQKDNT